MRTKILSIFTIAALLLFGCSEPNPPARSIEMASHGINGGALSVNGEYALVGSIFHGGSLWRNRDGERLYNWNHTQETDDRIIISADINHSNQRAITADAATLVLWDMNNGEALRFWTSPAEVLSSKLGYQGRFALLGLADHSAVIFDAVNGGIQRTFTHKGRVRSVDLDDNSTLAITGSEDHTAVIWRVSNSEPLMTIQHDEDVQLVVLSRDGQYALTAAKFDRVEVWDVTAEKSMGVIPLKKEQLKRGLRVTAARFSDDNRQLLLGYPNGTVELRDIATLNMLKQWTLPKRNRWQPTATSVIDFAFDPNEGYWVMSSDGFVHLLK